MTSKYNLAQKEFNTETARRMLTTPVVRENKKTKEIEYLPYSLAYIKTVTKLSKKELIALAKDIKDTAEKKALEKQIGDVLA